MAIHGVAKMHWTGDGITNGLSRVRYRNATSTDLTASQVAGMQAAVVACATAIKGHVPADVHMTSDPEVVCYDDATGLITSVVVDTTGPTTVNGLGSGSYVSGTGSRLHLLTGGIVRGRRVQGAIMFIPLVGGSFTASGNLDPSVAGDLINGGNALIDTGSGAIMVVWSRSKPARGAFPALVGSASDVLEVAIGPEPAVLRRRRF